jgi:membrane protease YdiL (CAAX protease family)
MNKKIMIQFVVLTFLITWFLLGSIIVANNFGYLQGDGITLNSETFVYMLILGCSACGPAIAAIVVLSKNKIMSVKQIFKHIFAIKQPIKAYMLTIGFLVLFHAMNVLTGASTYNGTPVYLALLTFPIMIIGGGFEEIGWRFFMQPELEKTFPFAISSSIVAVVWSVWHLPTFIMASTVQDSMSFGLFTIMCFGTAFALAAIYYLTKSVWLCILFHTLNNCLNESFTHNNSDFGKDLVPTVITSLVLIIISVIFVYARNKKLKNIKV